MSNNIDAVALLCHRMAASLRSEAIVATATPGWASSVLVSGVFGLGKESNGLHILRTFERATEPNELVRVDFYPSNILFELESELRTLRIELEPFIIGVGKIRIEDTPKGFIIFRNEDRFDDECHGAVLSGDNQAAR